MIKLSFMARTQVPEEYEGLINYAKNIGLDQIDLHVDKLPDKDFLRKTKWQCLRAGLPVGYYASGVSLVGPEDTRKARFDRAKGDCDAAAFVGAQVLHIFARHKWPATVEEQERLWKPMIEDMQELADYAEKQGVIVSLQNHNHSSFAMNANQVLRILYDVNRKNFTYIMDTGQWEGSMGGSPRGWRNAELDIYKEYHARVAPYATGVRAKIYKIDNGFEEWIDYPRVLRLLQAVDFNGCISIVFEGGQPERNRFPKDKCIEMAANYLREEITKSYSSALLPGAPLVG